MKTKILVLIFILKISSIAGAEPEKEIKGPVSRVTVYPDRAQLTHESSFDLQAGKTVLKLKGLSPYIDQQSIQVKGIGDFTILSVNHRNNFITNLEEQPDVKNIRAQITDLQLKVEDEKTAITVLDEKYSFLNSNKVVISKESAVTTEQYRTLLDLYSSNIEQISIARLKKQRLIKEYEKQITALQQQIANLLGRGKMPSGEISVTVSSEKPLTGRLTCSYIVSNAGWYPSYDIRVDDITRPVSIIYKANVYQNSGVEWKNVRLSFSNATPWVAGNVPVLNPWFIDFYVPVTYAPQGKQAAARARAMAPSLKMEEVTMADEVTILSAPEASMVAVEKRIGEMSVTFDVALPYTISPDGLVQTIEIQKSTTQAEYHYVTIPKLSDKAYLTGNITDWANQSLMSGETTLYFENTFVGNSYLNANQLKDTLVISLGADNGILVKREKRKDFTSKRIVGANKTEIYSFLITVRNNKTNRVKITVTDQVPVSSNSSITVEASELSGGKYDPVTGKITWDTELAPKETRELILTYSVKYPKNQSVILE